MKDFQEYGKHLFTGETARAYLNRHRLNEKILENPDWSLDEDRADKVRSHLYRVLNALKNSGVPT